MNFRPQKGTACQLIAAVNARIYLGLDDIVEEEFERLVDVVGARYGAAIRVHQAYPSLCLVHEDYPGQDTPDLAWVSANLPVEVAYYDRKYGFHAALVVDADDTHVMLANADDEVQAWENISFPPFPYQRRFRSFRLLEIVAHR